MYFINDLHKTNYNHLVNMVFRASKDREYKTASYILALPDIYIRCINDPMFHEFPFLWQYVYTDTSYTDKDEDGEYRVIDFEVKEDDEENPVISENYETLSSGHKKMVQLASNLFNSRNDSFNLMDSLNTWDEHHLKVFYQALDIRSGKEK